MFYLSYLWEETRRRWGRTLLTGIGLGVGVALVIAVSALSAGLDQAQKQVLKPLTGVGTDMTVQRPITVNNNGGGLSKKEQKQLQKEAGPGRVGLNNLGKPGSHFSRESLTSTSSLSFKESVEKDVAGISGVKELSGYLALNQVHVSGKVPKNSTQGGAGLGGGAGGGGGGGAPNISGVNFSTTTVTGIDASNPGLSPLSQSQIQKGHYLRDSGKYQAVVSLSYARDKSLGVGDKVSVGGKDFTIVGLAKQSLGGNTADIYVNLATLQKVAKYQGRVNSLDVRATSTGTVQSVSKAIPNVLSGAKVTTAQDLADEVGGTLASAQNLTGKLGTALEIVGLMAALLIASFLTLSSVAKRVRELGTLKAIGWPQRKVVRQVAMESTLQGALGGVLGAMLGIAAAAAIGAIGITLKATLSTASSTSNVPGPFGQGSASSVASTLVSLGAPVHSSIVLIAIALAIAGGLVAGAIGGLRAARLRPAEALRSVG